MTKAQSMTRDEMIKLIKSAPYKRISHRLFADDEYIYSDLEGLVWDEHDYLFEDWHDYHDGLRTRVGSVWDEDWYVKE